MYRTKECPQSDANIHRAVCVIHRNVVKGIFWAMCAPLFLFAPCPCMQSDVMSVQCVGRPCHLGHKMSDLVHFVAFPGRQDWSLEKCCSPTFNIDECENNI